MSIMSEFEIGDCSDNGSETTNLQMDTPQKFSLGLTDFEQYYAHTDLDTNHSKNIPVSQNNEVEKSGHSSDLLGAHELSENLERELNPTSSWLDSTPREGNEEFESTLRLTSSLYSNIREQSVRVQEEKTTEIDKFQPIKDEPSSTTESLSYPYQISQMGNSWTVTTSWANDHDQEAVCLYDKTKGSVSIPEQTMVSTNMIENGQHIPSSWIAATDTSTHSLAEVMAVPQTNTHQAPPFRVELGNDGQQYMIVDSKYLTQCTDGAVPLQMSDNTYYLAGMPMHHFGASQSSDSQSASTSSSLSSQQDSRAKSPFEAFSGFTEEDMRVDESVLEEQKRKELMQVRRREKNKDCSRAFRRKLKEKERTLREGRNDKQGILQELIKKNEKIFRVLSKVTIQGCGKAKNIASAGMQSWNKENRVLNFNVKLNCEK